MDMDVCDVCWLTILKMLIKMVNVKYLSSYLCLSVISVNKNCFKLCINVTDYPNIVYKII